MLKIVMGAPKLNAGRDVQDTGKYEEIVKDIIKDVRVNGDEALLNMPGNLTAKILIPLKLRRKKLMKCATENKSIKNQHIN